MYTGRLGKSGLFAFLGSARAAVGSFRKIGQFFDHLNFEKYEPGSLYVGPIFGQIFLKIDEIKIRPLTPPQNHFNTLPVLVADACIQEGWEKQKKKSLEDEPKPLVLNHLDHIIYRTASAVLLSDDVMLCQ